MINKESLKEFFIHMGMDTGKTMLELFKGSQTDYVKNIRNSIEKKDYEELAGNLHQFKGASALLKADVLVDFLIEFEKKIKEGKIETVEEDFQHLLDLYHKTIDEMDNLFQEMEDL